MERWPIIVSLMYMYSVCIIPPLQFFEVKRQRKELATLTCCTTHILSFQLPTPFLPFCKRKTTEGGANAQVQDIEHIIGPRGALGKAEQPNEGRSAKSALWQCVHLARNKWSQPIPMSEDICRASSLSMLVMKTSMKLSSFMKEARDSSFQKNTTDSTHHHEGTC